MNTDECQNSLKQPISISTSKLIGNLSRTCGCRTSKHRPGAGADGPKASNYGGFILPIVLMCLWKAKHRQHVMGLQISMIDGPCVSSKHVAKRMKQR